MKKSIISVFAAGVLLLSIPLYGYSDGGGFVAAYGGRHYGGRHYGGGHYGGGHHRGGHSGNRFYWRGSIWLGPGFFYGPGYPYPYYAGPPVIIQQQPPVYSQPEQSESNYWYYCQNPQGYYPYVKSCPGGWMKVIPEAPNQ